MTAVPSEPPPAELHSWVQQWGRGGQGKGPCAWLVGCPTCPHWLCGPTCDRGS